MLAGGFACLPGRRFVSSLPVRHAMLTAKHIQELLGLKPLPVEGGYFAEVYRSAHELPKGTFNGRYPGERALATAIYYLLTPDTFSAMHRLRGDETYHFYLGDPVEMLMLKPGGTAEAVLIGPDIAAGMRLQHTVCGGTWQGSRLAPGGKFALMGTTMSPGFDAQDYEGGKQEELSAAYPKYAALIAMLTR
jgi:uncharacterized protein